MRKVIRIDEEKCDGCGQCATACHERAIKVIGGKAKLVRIIRANGTPLLMVIKMEVPCCGGLLRLAEAAADEARVPLTLQHATLDVRGHTIEEDSVRYRFQ